MCIRCIKVFSSTPSGFARRSSGSSSRRKLSRSTCPRRTQAFSISSSHTFTRDVMYQPSLYRPFSFPIQTKGREGRRTTIHPTRLRIQMRLVGTVTVAPSHVGAVKDVVVGMKGISSACGKNIRECTGRIAAVHNVPILMVRLAGLVQHHASLLPSHRPYRNHLSTGQTDRIETIEDADQTADLLPHDQGHHRPSRRRRQIKHASKGKICARG